MAQPTVFLNYTPWLLYFTLKNTAIVNSNDDLEQADQELEQADQGLANEICKSDPKKESPQTAADIRSLSQLATGVLLDVWGLSSGECHYR